MTTRRRITEHALTAALVLIVSSLAMDAHCQDAAKLCAKVGCALPVSVVIDDSRNMPIGVYAHTTVSNGVCILTFTPDSVRRRSVVLHEVCHCKNDHAVLGPYGYEGVGFFEMEQREARAARCAKENR